MKRAEKIILSLGLVPLSCLADRETGCTWLCEEETLRRIVKLTDSGEEKLQLQNEFAILKRISVEAPQAFAIFSGARLEEKDGTVILIRPYIEGHSADALVEGQMDAPGLPPEQAVKLTQQVLYQAELLHAMRPPVIHRDIKPQNVVVDPEGNCHLIDFGIARTLRAEDDADARRKGFAIVDTQIYGTRLTAPPEQYGFRQTDARSDVYAIGILLRYCLSGEYGPEADGELAPGLGRIIRKATAFDPDRRYPSAKAMMSDLKRQEKWKKFHRLLLTLLILLLVLASVCILGWNVYAWNWEACVFQEPLLEKAVRLQLDRPEGPLTRQELAKVESLHIIGQQIYTDESQIWFMGQWIYMWDSAMREEGLFRENGGISSLQDLRLLPGLRELCLYNQNISDITELKGTRISRLGLGYNPLTDLKPLSGNEGISYMNIACTDMDPEAVLDVLVSMKGLKELAVCEVKLNSLNGLETLPELETLNVWGMDEPQDLHPIAAMPELKRMTVGTLTENMLQVLVQSGVTDLEVTHAGSISLSRMTEMSHLEKLYFYSDNRAIVESEPLSFPVLRWADLKNLKFRSLACVQGMPNLEELFIYASECLSYEGLEGAQNLKYIYCTAEQGEALRAMYPDAEWEIVD